MSERDRVLSRLKEAGMVHRRQTARVVLLRAVKYVFATVALLFALDVILHLSAGTRFLLTLSVIGGVGALTLVCLFAAEVRRSRLERVARLLEEREPSLGSSLINLLQLEAEVQNEKLTPLTRDLAKRAMEDYSRRLQGVDFLTLARLPSLKREYKKAGWAVAGFAAVTVLFYQVVMVEAPRFLLPFGDHPPFSLTQLTITSPEADGARVVYDEGILVEAEFSGHRPGDLYLTAFDPADREGTAFTLPMFPKGKEGFVQRIDNIHTDLSVYVHTRNHHSVSRQRKIGVILTPRAEEAFVEVTPPAYTRREARESTYHFKNVRALAGSDVTFRLRSNRPLDHGTLSLTGSDGGERSVRMERNGEHEVKGGLPARETGRLGFSLVDVNQRVSAEEYRGSLTVVYDLPPSVRITEPGQNAMVSRDFRMSIQVDASDDYGLSKVRLHRGLNGVYSRPLTVSLEEEPRRHTMGVPLPLPDLGVSSGDVISIYAEAIDNRPDPQMARSQVVHLTVITEEEYNEALRRQSEIAQIWGKYNELAERMRRALEEQEELAGRMAELRERIEASGDADLVAELEAELDELADRQEELNERLGSLAEDMETFVRDNPLYDIEHEFQQRLTESASAIREALAAQESALGAAEQRAPGAPAAADALRQMEEASREMADALRDGEQRTREEILATIEDLAPMQALVLDFHRFRILYQRQTALVEQVRPYNTETRLRQEDRLALNQLAAEERLIGQGIEGVVEKLRRDADAAEERFPKAAASGRELAERIEEKRLAYIADRASQVMLSGRGPESYEAAERLRQEMSEFFGDENDSFGGPPPGMDISEMGHEMDRFISLNRGMECNGTFGQMCLSQMFGDQPGRGPGTGWGMAGFMAMGSTVGSAPQMEMIGGESFLNEGGIPSTTSPPGTGEGERADLAELAEARQADESFGGDSEERTSGAVSSDNLIDEYRDIVDAYFIKITE